MPESMREIFVRKLRLYADMKGVSQADIAAAMDVATSTVSYWFNGVKITRVDMMQRLAAYLGVTTSQLISEDPEPEDELTDLREIFRRRPEMRTLFSLTRKATPEQVKMFIRMIEAMEEKNE